MNRKQLATFGVAGGRALKDISGPGSTITDSDRYKFCVADVAGECAAGSLAGDIYLNVPNLVQSYRYCAAGEISQLGGEWDDACAGERSMMGHNNVQLGVLDPTVAGKIWYDTTAKHSRALTTIFDPYRYSSLGSFQPLPDASFALFQGFDRSLSHWLWMMAKVPPMPPPDSVTRSTFVPIAVQLNPPANLGVNNAIVEFGYNTSFHCTQRPEKCVANAATVNQSNPFTWPTEAGGDTSVTGLACSPGCTITVPALSQKILYYRWKYRDGSNAVVGESDVQVVAVP
jgi:hypothetical protein